MDILSIIISLLIMVPILALLICFVGMKFWSGKTKTAIQFSLDGSTLFFILAVHLLVQVIWQFSFLWMLLILLLAIFMMFVMIYWRTRGEIVFKRVFKSFWRLSFLLFFIGYWVLLAYGVGRSVYMSVS